MSSKKVVLDALKTWREHLVGLGGRNRLIRYNAPKRSSLTFDFPDADEIFAQLCSDRLMELYGDVYADEELVAPPAPRREAFHVPRLESEIGPVARGLMRRANEEFLDRGLSVLYVTFGMLRWKDIDDSDMASPLYLVPVDLVPEGPRAMPRLRVSGDDHVLNPALPLRLVEYGVQWPTLEEVEDLCITEILNLFRGNIAKAKDFKGWEVTAEIHLAAFSFSKEAMYKDLKDNEEIISEHPVVRALANTDPTTQTDIFQFDPIDPADIDEAAPLEDTPLVLDADSSQRAAVAAALAGKSFVMDGPPGTGKSQTIANMIGALMHTGKSVLFVSEKIAALDVVRNRLTEAGLGSYLLELHSHKTNRREVATELLKTLDNVAQPPAGMTAISRATLKDRRKRLNQYAIAMNEIRSPLERSLHDVLGTLAQLNHVATAPMPERPPLKLDERGLANLLETLSQLERNWRPAAQGNSFLWREVTDETSLESRLWAAKKALEQLKGTMGFNAELAKAFNIHDPGGAATMVSLLNRQHNTKPLLVNDLWLTTPDWDSVELDRQEMGELVEAHRACDVKTRNLSDSSYQAFPAKGPSTPKNPLVYQAIDLQQLTSGQLSSMTDYLEHHHSSLSMAFQSLNGLAQLAGLPSPITWADADRIISLFELSTLDTVVEPSWLTTTGLNTARNAAAAIRSKALELDSAEETAHRIYRPDALSAPLYELRDRFDNIHRGLRKLSGAYRADKKEIVALLADAKHVKSGISRLSDAIAWLEANKDFEIVGLVHSRVLGKYWRGRDTDWDSLESGFSVAEEVITLSSGDVTSQTVTLFSKSSNPAHEQVLVRAKHALGIWKDSLAPFPAIAGRPELLMEPIEESLKWITAHLDLKDQAIHVVDIVNEVTGGDHTLEEAGEILRASEEAWNAAAMLDAARSRFSTQFGELFRGADTDLEEVDTALNWTRNIREFIPTGRLTPEQLSALASSSPMESLSHSLEKWEAARDAILAAFSEERRSELIVDFSSFGDAFELLEEFGADTIGQQEWFEYIRIRQELCELDLDTTVEFCIENRIASTDVSKVIERALLRAWADAQIFDDPRLDPLISTDRDALVEEFKSLDMSLIAAATGEIIRVANSRRPASTSIGEPALIRREGMKRRRHIPVRDLISRARSAIQSIKPVFMMSPLAVSQYLPPDMKFDVVIFDEASQVTPGDSINCIYRGRSFILAGDDKQLPPTQFFERSLEPDEGLESDADVQDFQSILELAKSAGAFQNLGLRWHYRSRHESLIAFSNYRFYEGKLITYPSAKEEGADVGVEFIHANGTYRRGGGSDNPLEARLVAERVIHHYQTRPQASLGVVTFSVKQAEAIHAAVDVLREMHRDLDGYFDRSDRLDGFFVRSLESVQGDERDVIIFSIGYGPDEAGKISTNFGVLNKEKGWRRLNVGITRARQRVEVISSMEAHDIPPSQNENVEALRSYLDFAKRGISVLGTQSSATGLMPESPFEESVISTIKSWGYSVEPQVGAAGYRIDLAVRHPAKPGMFALGVECDGYQYHSSPAARDRDRLRDQVLEGLGWTLHRIWGTSWYRDRGTEEKRLQFAIEEAISGGKSVQDRNRATLLRAEVETLPARDDSDYSWAASYEEATPVYLPHYVEPGGDGSYLSMATAIRTLVETEGPIHLVVINERIRDWWDVGRVSSRLKQNILLAIKKARLEQDGEFIDVPGRPVRNVRCRENTRKPEHVHLDEFALAAESVVRDVGGASRSEVVTHIARLFNWARNGSVLDERLNQAIDRAIKHGQLSEREGHLSVRD